MKGNPEPGLPRALFCPGSRTVFLHPQPAATVQIRSYSLGGERLAACPGDGSSDTSGLCTPTIHLGQSGFSLAGIEDLI